MVACNHEDSNAGMMTFVDGFNRFGTSRITQTRHSNKGKAARFFAVDRLGCVIAMTDRHRQDTKTIFRELLVTLFQPLMVKFTCFTIGIEHLGTHLGDPLGCPFDQDQLATVFVAIFMDRCRESLLGAKRDLIDLRKTLQQFFSGHIELARRRQQGDLHRIAFTCGAVFFRVFFVVA